MYKGQIFENFGCIWIVDDIYTVPKPDMEKYDLIYSTRYKAHVIEAPDGYLGITEIDAALYR